LVAAVTKLLAINATVSWPRVPQPKAVGRFEAASKPSAKVWSFIMNGLYQLVLELIGRKRR